MKKLARLWHLILENNSRLFFKSKKAIFLFLIVTIASFFLKTEHDGSLIDIIWTNFYIIGPSIIGFLLLLLFYLTAKSQN